MQHSKSVYNIRRCCIAEIWLILTDKDYHSY